MDWNKIEEDLKDEKSDASFIFKNLSQLISIRKREEALSLGSIKIFDLFSKEKVLNESLLSFEREFDGKKIVVITNLSCKKQNFQLPSFLSSSFVDLISSKSFESPTELHLEAFQSFWLKDLPN